MAYWLWLTQEGESRVGSFTSQRGHVIRALAAEQPATLGTITARAEKDGARFSGVPSDVVSYYLWEFRRSGLVDVQKVGSAKQRYRSRLSAASAPTLAEAVALALARPMTAAQLAADLAAVGRRDAGATDVSAILSGASFARVDAADGRAVYVLRARGGQ